jgi:hypothetical protein
MTMRLCFRADLNPMLLNWGAPNERVADRCSICETAFAPDAAPLVVWNADDWCVRICDACVDRWVRVQ